MTDDETKGMKFRIGLLINPLAGIGGAVALKGSDGKEIVERAKSLGGKSPAPERTRVCLQHIVDHFKEPGKEQGSESVSKIQFVTWDGDMGANIFSSGSLKREKIEYEILGAPEKGTSSAADTRLAASEFRKAGVDLILFAGGDGTARDICEVVNRNQVVLGIPSGVKMHSGVFANNPEAAARVVIEMIEGRLVSAVDAEVRDIDEDAFRRGEVRAKYFGSMLVPEELRYLQQVKSGGKELEDLVVQEIAADIVENMADDCFYFIGSGTTTAAIMELLDLPNTLLGVDVIKAGELLVSDAREDQLYDFSCAARAGEIAEAVSSGSGSSNVKLVITVIGGQGHLLGRGNQQLSPRVLKKIGRDNVLVVASKSKLEALDDRPLLMDTGDESLDHEWRGLIRILTGYEDSVLYRVDS